MNNINWETIPELISKQQFCRICHVSSRTALYLIQSGKVPSINTGKKTHSYWIKKSDAQEYLIRREKYPEEYKPLQGWYAGYANKELPVPEFSFEQLRRFWTNELKDYSDVLTSKDVSRIIGYRKDTINEWCNEGYIHFFNRKHCKYIPKSCLIDFLCSPRARTIGVKSEWHKNKMKDFFVLIRIENHAKKERGLDL